MSHIRQMEACCDKFGVALKAAALQFSTKDPRVASTIVGVSHPEHVDETVDLFRLSLPQALWDELEALVPPEQSWLR